MTDTNCPESGFSWC